MATKNWKTSTVVNYITGYLYGMSLANNGTDATNDIDIAVGKCVDSTGVRVLSGGALTKQLDAAWAAGNAAGGRLSAAAITNTTYHVFAILKDSDNSVDYGFDVSPTAPTMPVGYTYFRRIGSVLRESAALVSFRQIGDKFIRDVRSAEISVANPGTAAVTAVLRVPTGLIVEAIVYAQVLDITPAASTALLMTALAQTDTDPSGGAGVGQLFLAGGATKATIIDCVGAEATVFTDTAASIRYRLSASNADISAYIHTRGWIDTRGRQG